ncbi:MAG TPA: glycosyltransferase family 4 protein [Bryobacteraceae bacterium]|nr:glycosyltransferase family 4 protein [Bryobacteraceae bacterium]
MKPVRVLLIAPSLDIVGGQSVQAARLLAELRKLPQLSIDFLPVNPQAPAPLRPLQKIKYVRTLVTSALYAIRLVANIAKYDILHIFTPGYFAFMLAPAPAILLAKFLGKKKILNYRDGRAEDHLTRWPSAIRIMRLVDEIVAPSNFLVDVFSGFGLPARSIPNIVDLEQFHFRERNRLRPAFLHNRGLEPLYNVQCTIRAFALIQERYPDATLTIAHDGPLRKQLEQMASDLRLQNVKFIGSVSREQTPGVYNEADIYLTNPDIDNMPVSVLECFAAGLPIISTRVGGVPYILEHERTGLLVGRDDHVGIAQAAFRLLEEPGLAAQLTRAAREECRKYTPAAVAGAWLALYKSLAADKNLHPAQELHNSHCPARTHGSSPQ